MDDWPRRGSFMNHTDEFPDEFPETAARKFWSEKEIDAGGGPTDKFTWEAGDITRVYTKAEMEGRVVSGFAVGWFACLLFVAVAEHWFGI